MVRFSIEPNPRVPFKIRHEDEDLLVVEKPAGVPTQPGRGHLHDTLLNGAFDRYGTKLQNLGKARDFGLLHRLDLPTSGLVVIALSARAYDAMRERFASRGVRKYYWAVVKGTPRSQQGVIRKPILEVGGDAGDDGVEGGRHRPKRAKISSAGKPSVTAYRTLGSGSGAAILECRPVTGRLHQVRVHLAAIHCPILGDDVYGNRAVRSAAPRLALHAHRLSFTHPIQDIPIDIRTTWPGDLKGLLRRLNLATPESSKAPPAGEEPEADLGAGPVEGGHEVDGDAVGEEDPFVGGDPTRPDSA